MLTADILYSEEYLRLCRRSYAHAIIFSWREHTLDEMAWDIEQSIFNDRRVMMARRTIRPTTDNSGEVLAQALVRRAHVEEVYGSGHD